MKRISMLTVLGSLLVAGVALAQSGATGPQTSGSAQAASGAINAGAAVEANADTKAGASLADLKKALVARAAKTSTAARAKAGRQLDAAAKRVDAAAAKGEGQVADRLAKEFGITAEAMTQEKAELNTSWGQLMIAHTLDANAKSDATGAQLVELHAEGMGWGPIAAGLGLSLGEAVSAANAEQRVADGAAKADGKVAVIHGEGARAGLGMNAGLGAKGLGANATGGVSTGLKIGH